MKVNVDLNIEVVMDIRADSDGTSIQGRLPEGTNYDDVVRVFGQPQFGKSPDGKTQVEWVGVVNDHVFTIYDFKSKVFPQQNKDWHIGGECPLIAELIKAYFQAHMREQSK